MKLIQLVCLLFAASISISHAEDRASRQKNIQDNWYRCLQIYALTIAGKTNEPSTVIADAAITACQKEEDKLFYFYGENKPEPVRSFIQTEILSAQRENYKKKLLVEILALRAS